MINSKFKIQNSKLESGKKKHGSRFEHSAGGVIYRKLDKNIEILLLKDKNAEWSFPKGLIEKDEEAVVAAKREMSEEVGLNNLVFIDKLNSIEYFYHFGSSLIRKKVDFFLFRYDGSEIPKPLAAEGIQDVQWFTLEKTLETIGYTEANKPILEQSIRLIRDS